MNPKRIVLDTNLWISSLISNNYLELENMISNKEVILVFSEELLSEFISVTRRPKFIKYFSLSDIEKLLNIFDQFGILIDIKSNVDICRDPKDNFILNLCIDGKVDFLISGDNDLLVIDKIGKTKIVNYKTFIGVINSY